jgi:hypothetical protein
MSVPQQKITVLKSQTRDTVRAEVVDRAFLLQLRRALLQQLAVLEKALGMTRRCGKCGSDVLTYLSS